MASLFGSNASRAAQHAAERAQQAQVNLGNQGDVFSQQYQQALPGLSAAQTYFLQRAGLIGTGSNGQPIYPGYGTPQTTAPMGTAPGVNGGKPFAAYGSRKSLPGFQQTQAAGTQTGPSLQDRINNGALGIYNSPEYQLLRQQAQEDVGRQTANAGHAYGNQLLGRGLQNSSLMAGGQAGITAAGNKEYSDFVRNLAMNAANKQDTLVNQAMQSLNPSLAAGQSATSAYGSAGGLSNQGIGINQQVKAQQGSVLSNALGSIGQLAYPALSSYLGGMGFGAGAGGGVPGGINAGGIAGDTAAAGISDGGTLATALPAFAQGGYAHQGQPAVVGERGGEAFVPKKFFSQLGDLFHHAYQMGSSTSALPARALGGPVNSNQPFLVGENGPEVFTPPQDGYIVPNPSNATPLHPNVNSVLQFVISQGVL